MDGLGRAISGLNAARILIEVSGENISNQNTPGYHRKRVSLEAIPGAHSANVVIGAGVEPDSIERVRDELTERVLLTNIQLKSRLTQTSDLLGKLETYFQEPSDAGFDSRLGELFQSLRSLTSDPNDISQRRVVVQRAKSATNMLNQLDDEMDTMASYVKMSLDDAVDTVNQLTAEIANYNQEILHLEAGGNRLTTLRDKRDNAINELAEMLNLKVHTTENGHKNILVGGTMLVSGKDSYDIVAVQNKDGVEIQALGHALNVQDGKLGGLMEMKNHFIPNYQQRLDDLANGMRRAFNRLHSTGLGSAGRFSYIEANNAFGENISLQELGYDGVPQETDGTLYFNVEDTSTGEIVQEELTGLDTTQGANDLVSDIATKLAGIDHISASENNGRLQINAEDGYKFGFATQYDPNPSYVTGSAPPEVKVHGAFNANEDLQYSVEFLDDGTIGDDQIELKVDVTDEGGTTTTYTRRIEPGHLPSDPIDLPHGLHLTVSNEAVSSGEKVAFEARQSMDPLGLLDALGVNTMFDGLGAGGIHVNEKLSDDARLLATSLSESSGDNERILDMLELEEGDVLDSQSLHEFYRNLISDVANERNTKDTQLTSIENVVSDLQDARDGVSGVSVEEEMMTMMQSQRLYQGLTKYVQSLNSAYDDLLRII